MTFNLFSFFLSSSKKESFHLRRATAKNIGGTVAIRAHVISPLPPLLPPLWRWTERERNGGRPNFIYFQPLTRGQQFAGLYDVHVGGGGVESRFLERRSRIGRKVAVVRLPAPRVCRDTGRCRIAFNPDGLRWQGTSGRARAFYELLARLKFVRIYPATSLSAARGKGKSRDNKKESRIAANSPSLLSFLFFSHSWAFLSELKELTS